MPTVIALKDVLADLRGDPDLKNLPDNASVLSDVGLDSLELLQFMLEIEASGPPRNVSTRNPSSGATRWRRSASTRRRSRWGPLR